MIRRRAAHALLFMLAAVAVSPSTVTTQSPALPTPESVLGFRPGADYKLATYEDVVGYFQRLDAATDRMTMVEAGKSTQGRTYALALISSPANLKNIGRLREISRRLAHPDGMTEAEARALSKEGKAFVHIDGGLHATEVAGPQHTPQLAYDILSRADEPDTAMALDNVVLMLWPTINPDGQTMVAEWYRSNVGTPFEVAPLPTLYQEYVGHDNNRDGYMLNMIESRVMEHAWREWEPQVIHVHHQTAPFPARIWLPPCAEPIASRVPHLLSREVNMIGMAMAKGLEERGQVGATHMGTGFDAWYPGYIDYKPMLQNIASFWTETALYQYATPRFYTPQDFPADMRDLRPQSLYSSPWTGGWWRLRDAVEYMETASLSVIDWAARYKESLLLNRYRAGRQQIEKFRTGPPYAYVVPQQQRDPVAAVELLRRLAFQGIRVSQLTVAAAIDGVRYGAGTWVIPMDQEFAETARQVLEVQKYPELRESPDGPLEQPYDAAGWTLPYQMGVQVTASMTPLPADAKSALKMLGAVPSFTAAPTPYDSGPTDRAAFDSLPGVGFESSAAAAAIVPPAGKAIGSGSVLLVDPAQNNSFRALNRAWKAGGTVKFVAATGAKGGRYAVSGLTEAALTEMVTALALQAERAPSATGPDVKKPRIGLYRPWQASMDEGWTRWVLEQYGFDLVSLTPSDLRGAVVLADRVDVLIIADEARGLMDGYAAGIMPLRYAGGIGTEGVRAIDAFVRGGGTLVAFNRSSLFAIDQLHLPVKNVVAGAKRQEFFTGGSLLESEVEPGQPVMAGMPDRAPIFVDSSPVFEPLDGFAGHVLARYQAAGSPLLSGYLVGEKFLNGKAAALVVQHAAGRVVLLGFRPQWRGQPFGTFRVIFNAVVAGAISQ